jgi:hypothetical protein
MSTRTQPHPAPQHLGEREFLDYPVFLESGLEERRELLTRTLAASLAIVACVSVAAAAALLLLG